MVIAVIIIIIMQITTVQTCSLFPVFSLTFYIPFSYKPHRLHLRNHEEVGFVQV